MNSHSWIGIVLILTTVATLAIGECIFDKLISFETEFNCTINGGGLKFSNGQLFTYKGTCDNGISTHWSTATVARGTRAIFQPDKDFAVWDIDNNYLFRSFAPHNKIQRLVLRDDGNLVILDKKNQTVWETGPFEPLVCPCVRDEYPPQHPDGGLHFPDYPVFHNSNGREHIPDGGHRIPDGAHHH